jgi:hypothetical protein
MSAPPAYMATLPIAALWAASGGALSVPAALVAVGLLASIVLVCLVAGGFSAGKGGRPDGPPRR